MENRVMQGSDSVKIFELCTQSVMLLKKCTIFKKKTTKKNNNNTPLFINIFKCCGWKWGEKLLTLNS